MESIVIARASRDFSCAREQTAIVDILGPIYRVEGCGVSATYKCRETNALVTACVAVDGSRSAATHGPAAGR
jgi:hypothetical protein